MERGNIRRTRITELTINLVREKEQIVLLDDIANLVHLLLGIKIAGRIIGIANQDRLGPGRDQCLELLQGRQGKTLIDRGRDCLDNRTARDSESHIVRISRFWNDNLITRIEASHKGEEDRLRTTSRNDDIIHVHMNIEFGVITHQFLPETADTLTGRILHYGPVHMTHRLQGYLWCRQIRLSDIQMINLDSPLFSLIGQRYKFSNWRSRHIDSSLRNIWHLLYFLLIEPQIYKKPFVSMRI